MGNIYIRGLELPAKTRGVVVDVEDDFIVFINTNLTPSRQRTAVKHELKHIKEDHFYQDEPVVYDELQACQS